MRFFFSLLFMVVLMGSLYPTTSRAGLLAAMKEEEQVRINSEYIEDNSRRRALVKEQALSFAHMSIEKLFEPVFESIHFDARLAARSGNSALSEHLQAADAKLQHMVQDYKDQLNEEYENTRSLFGVELQQALEKQAQIFVQALSDVPHTTSRAGSLQSLFPILKVIRAYHRALFLALKTKNPNPEEILKQGDPQEVKNLRQGKRVGRALGWMIALGAAVGAHTLLGYTIPGWDPSLNMDTKVIHLLFDVPLFLSLNAAVVTGVNRLGNSDQSLRKRQLKVGLKNLENHFFRPIGEHYDELQGNIKTLLTERMPEMFLHEQKKQKDMNHICRLVLQSAQQEEQAKNVEKVRVVPDSERAEPEGVETRASEGLKGANK